MRYTPKHRHDHPQPDTRTSATRLRTARISFNWPSSTAGASPVRDANTCWRSTIDTWSFSSRNVIFPGSGATATDCSPFITTKWPQSWWNDTNDLCVTSSVRRESLQWPEPLDLPLAAGGDSPPGEAIRLTSISLSLSLSLSASPPALSLSSWSPPPPLATSRSGCTTHTHFPTYPVCRLEIGTAIGRHTDWLVNPRLPAPGRDPNAGAAAAEAPTAAPPLPGTVAPGAPLAQTAPAIPGTDAGPPPFAAPEADGSTPSALS